MGSYRVVNCLKIVNLVVMVVVVVGAPKGAIAEITCGDVVRALTPCINYVANGGAVPDACCSGIKTLYGSAKTTPDRQSVCRCLKSAASAYSGSFNLGLAAGLPAKCHVNLPYKIDPSTNCNNVK